MTYDRSDDDLKTAAADARTRVRELLPHLLSGRHVLDTDTRYLAIDEAATIHGGRAADELVGQTLRDHFPGFAQTALGAAILRCLDVGAPTSLTCDRLLPGGRGARFEVRVERIAEGVAVHSIDVGQLQCAERALEAAEPASHGQQAGPPAGSPEFRSPWQDSEPPYQAFFAHSFDALLLTEPGGVVMAANPAACRLFGLDQSELVGAGQRTLVDSTDPRAAELLAARARDGRVVGRVRLRRKGGDTFEAELSSVLFETPAGTRTSVVIRDVSDLVEAQTALRESESRYRLLLEHAPVGIAVHVGGVVAFANPAGAEVLRYDSPEQLVGVPIADVVHPDCWDDAHARIGRLLAGESGLYPTVDRYLRRDGSVADVEVMAVPLEYGGRPAVQVIITDISERLALERALHSSNEKYATFFEMLPFPASLARAPEGAIVEINQAFEAAFGIPRSEAIGKTSIELGLYVDPGRRAQSVEEALGSRRVRGVELTLNTRHAGPREYFVRSATVTIEGVIHSVQTAQDITERKRALEALRASERRFADAFHFSPAGLTITRIRDGKFVEANAAFLAMSGFERDEVIGKTSITLGMLEAGQRGRLIADQVDSGGLKHTQYRARTKSGAPLDIIFSSSPLVIDDEPHHITTMIDVSEQGRIQEQLLHAQKLESVGRLAGGVAHDFNNIIAAILTFSRFAIDALPDEDPVREDILEVELAARRAANLTRQLLAFSRRQVLAPEVLDVDVVIRGVDGMLQRLIGEDVEITTNLASGSCWVLADPGQIEQMVMNLAINARDAMPTGGELTIETAGVQLDAKRAAGLSLQAGDHVLVSVIDTGIGMHPEVRRQAFDPFFTTKEEGRGTGLGLATVWGIVQSAGGSIHLASEPGRGTTVEVYLPRTERPPAPSKREAPARGGRGETVLLVEDEEQVRRGAARILRKAGYRVVEAPGGHVALRLVEQREGPIDLLLSDVVMPGMGGAELAKRIAQVRPGVRVLLMSGYLDDTVANHGALEPGTQLVAKPFTEADLIGAVRNVLDAPAP